MSGKSTGQWVGTVVGGVVGWFMGGPAGAFRGAVIGSSLGGYIDPPKGPALKGPRLDDLNYQYASYGQALGRHYATIASMGNVIWVENNRIKEVSKKERVGGKGGSSQTLETFSYFATFAVAFNDGPIEAVRRIWINGQLLYNAGSDDIGTLLASVRNAGGAFCGEEQQGSIRMYYGSDDQLPDPRIEADLGVGNTPAFRGTAYLVFYDLPLEKYGNTLAGAQIKVEMLTNAAIETQQHMYSQIFYPRTGDPALDARASGVRVLSSCGSSSAIVPHRAGSESGGADGAKAVLMTAELNGGVRRQTYGRPQGADPANTDVAALPGHSNSSAYWVVYRIAPYGSEQHWSSTSGATTVTYEGLIPSKVFEEGSRVIMLLQEPATGLWRLAGPGLDLVLPSAGFTTGYGDGIFVGDGLIAVFERRTEDFEGSVSVTLYDYQGLFYAAFSVSMPAVSSANAGQIFNGFIYVILQTNPSSSGAATLRKIAIDGSTVDDIALSFPAHPGVTPSNITMNIQPGLLAWGQRVDIAGEDGNGRWIVHVHRLNGVNEDTTFLADVIREECLRCDYLVDDDLDLSLVDDELRGFRIAGVMSARDALGPLLGAYAIDVISSGYQIKFIPRGRASVASVNAGELDARKYGDAPQQRLTIERQMDSQLPFQVLLTHIDSARDYEPNQQPSLQRLDARTTRINELEMPVVFTPDEAAKVAQKFFDAAWLEREAYQSLKLSPAYRGLEPADVFTVDDGAVLHELIISEISYVDDGRLEITAKPNAVALWTPTAVGGQGSVSDGTIPMLTPAEAVLMDIPCVIDAMNTPGFAAAMYSDGEGWPGGVLMVSDNQGQTYSAVQGFAGDAPIAWANGVLPADEGLYIDYVSTLNVTILAGAFESVSIDIMMTGVNYCAYGADGRWEIMQYALATAEGDGTVTLSGFVRGLRGTEWATALHEVGDLVVLLDDADVEFVTVSNAAISVERLYKAVTIGTDAQGADEFAFTYRAVNLMPLSVVQVSVSTIDDDWIVGWEPRTRLQSAQWNTGQPAPIGETEKRYEIDVLDADLVIATYSVVGVDEWNYTAAQQINDFGSLVTGLHLHIYQISSVVGRGFVRDVVLGEE